MSMEDSLFPLSPRDEQKVGDDSMECAAADLLLEAADSLFNDSLDDMQVSKNTIRVAMTEPTDDSNGRGLDDSLDLDETQLPALNMDGESVNPLDNATTGTSDRNTQSAMTQKAGFQVAENIPLSGPIDISSRNDKSSTGRAHDGQTDKRQQNTLQNDYEPGCDNTSSGQSCTSSPPAPSPDNSTASSKVVPSFGKRRGKSNVMQTTKKPERGLPSKGTGKPSKGALAAKQSDCQKENCPTSEENQEKNHDQCVPESTGSSRKPKKPTFNPASCTSNKHPSKPDQAIPVMEEKEGKGLSTETVKKTLPESKSAETKEKKLTAREEKKQEREERKREIEKKKLEREQRKCEAEEKKAEKERLKKEQEFERERKKAEREQNKIEKALKKVERLEKKHDGQQGGAKKSKKKGNSDPQSTDSASGTNPTTAQSEVAGKDEPVHKDPAQACDHQAMTEKVKADVESDGTAKCDGISPISGVTPPEENATLPENHEVTQSDKTVHENDSLGLISSEVNHFDKSSDITSSPAVAATAEPNTASLPTQRADEGACDTNPVLESSEQSSQGDGLTIDESAVESVETTSGNDESHNQTLDTSVHKDEEQGERVKIVFGKKARAGVNVTRDISISLPKTLVNSTHRGKINTKKSSTKTKSTGVTRASGTNKKPSIKCSNGVVRSKQRKRSRQEDKNSAGDGTKRSKPSNYTGPVWVQCDACQKWRRLRDCSDPLSLPDSWNCTMHTDPERGSCSAAEEHWSEELGDSQEFVETSFIPGSLVWAKMDGYPWWPAMVEEDPDKESYYEMGKRSTSSIPVKYHVVFFGTPVSRSWVSNFHIHPYTEDRDYNTNTGVSVTQKLRQGLKDSRKQANRASDMTFTRRLIECSFSKRFRRTAKKRKTGEDTETETYIGQGKLSSSSTVGHKSARLCDRDTALVESSREEGEGQKERERKCDDSVSVGGEDDGEDGEVDEQEECEKEESG